MALLDSVCVIKGNVTSFTQLLLHPDVVSINVHCNSIHDFNGLQSLKSLKILDASSNLIQSFSGLQHLSSLCVLNLACNNIRDVRGLGSLVNLVSLNLSYNDISGLQGFVEINGASYKLETLELHGNQISSKEDVVSHLQGVLNLRHLVLSQDDTHTNPVCHKADYRKDVLRGIPQLVSLDHKDRNNVTVTPSADAVLEMLGLDLSLGDMESNSENVSDVLPAEPLRHPEKSMVKTPNIDAVLSKVKTRPGKSTLTSDNEDLVESIITSIECHKATTDDVTFSEVPEQLFQDHPVDQEVRLKYLEEQLANLVAARQEKKPTAMKMSAPGDNSEVTISSGTSPPRVTKGKPIIHASAKRTVSKRNSSLQVKPGSKMGQNKSSEADLRPGDAQTGAQEKNTYLNLVKELENERERRWKSEQAARRLAQLVRDMHSEKTEGKSLQDMAAQTADRLKQALLRERETSDKMRSEVNICKEKLAEMSDQVSKYKLTIEEQQASLSAMEATTVKANSDRAKMSASQSKKLHESDMRVSAALKEVDLQKSQNNQLRQRLSELQEILIGREQEHKKVMENMFSEDSVEFRNAVSREVNREEERHREDVKMLQQTIALLRTQYTDLENEFRQALHIEAARYEKADTQLQRCSGELEKMQSMYRKVKDKEEKSRSIVSELTSVAKEQKIKIVELTKNKQEILQQYKERIESLEIASENDRKKGVQLELIKQEKSRLVSQLAAVQSVVDGLRDERKLWGHELAQQGASLAQDRGRLESRIETLQLEMASLRKQNGLDLDALKIKSKIVDDQTETINKMKQALVDKDNEISRVQEDGLNIQRKLEHDIEDLTQDNAALNEQISVLLERKKELKAKLADSGKELDDMKQGHSKLVKKWAEKGQVLSQLESQVRQMKESCDTKVQKLVKEKEEALEAKRLVTERMERVDIAFREQLEAANSAHEEELVRIARNNQTEMESMKRKVLSVEEEMREVLRDADRQKKSMEGKLKRITSAFKDLQEGFVD